MRPKDESYITGPPQNGYRREYATMEPYAASIIKVITLRRRGNAPLGFSIRGGWEHGTGVFVSEIIPGSIAQKQGLRVGDQIVRINGFSIHRAIHMEVLSLLKTCPGIVLKIKRVGILPVKERDKDPVTWKIVEPHQSSLIYSDQVAHSRMNGSTLENSIIVKVEISVPGNASLGCSIAKGPEELPGIFMCTVKEGGIADQAGLQVGDQILDMNGTSFNDLKLSEAVARMKSAKDIRLTVKKGAGISLFLDNGSTSQLSNCNKNEDTISTSRSLSDGLSATLKDHDFSGSCSSKSERSSFQSSVSSDSEKDYSISEESAFEGMSNKKSRWPPPPQKKSPSPPTEDDAWILEEKRIIEEDRRKLEEEKRRLEEEKRKLELEKSSSVSSSSSSQPPSLEESSSFKDNSFLNELQKVASRMNSKENRVFDEPKNGTLGKPNRPEIFKGKRGKEDAIKRMQHEMLMEEFREAHRKMFGQHSVMVVDENGKNEEDSKAANGDSKTISSDSSKISIKAKAKPPPPPPKSVENNKECQKITVNGQVPGLQSQTVPRPEKLVPLIEKAPEKETPKVIPQAATNGLRVTVTGARPTENSCAAAASKTKTGALVEVTPWTTRL
ncbi:hypothetical protein NPIL_11691 [Nephila pilipes]|uniref:PDZ domain-containing protein n=1 Tax=Nephila pilipes TaxID=299642 RepID=A0A8X6T857_NEPPI|nr:hypothetical protein NPIL_11691 [Nephila pilipes]